MSDTAAAMRAAREVQAPLLSPILYGRAREYWDRSKAAFKFKDFKEATLFAQRARKLAEEAEFESLCCRGGKRNSVNIKDPLDAVGENLEVKPSTPSPDAGLLDGVAPPTPSDGSSNSAPDINNSGNSGSTAPPSEPSGSSIPDSTVEEDYDSDE